MSRTKRDTTGKLLPPEEQPDEDSLLAYGDTSFLAMRCPRHRQMAMADFRIWVEPPILLRQVRVFRVEGVPRGMFTWGFLSEAAEKRLITGEHLNGQDWRSGPRLWIVSLIAPYNGMTAGIVRWIMTPGIFADKFCYRRVEGVGTTRRIVEIDKTRPSKSRVFTAESYLAQQETDAES